MELKYKDIYNQIKDQIIQGTLAPNTKIDDEISLCKQYRCSRMTMKKALDLLVQDGLLFRKRGVGSFVMGQPLQKQRISLNERELSGLTRSAKQDVSSKILEFKLIFASKEIASFLNVKENDPLYYISRLRFIKGEPVVIEYTYMIPTLIPGLCQDVLLGSIYNYIENTLGYKISSSKKSTRADKSNSIDQKYLQLDPTEPVLEVEQVAYLDNGIPFEYSISRHRYDQFEFSIYSVRI